MALPPIHRHANHRHANHRMTRWSKQTLYDRLPEMIAFFNADATRAFRDVAERFGCSRHYVRVLMGPHVQPRGKMRKDGTRPILVRAGRDRVALDGSLPLPPQHRRVLCRAGLEQDPDVIRCREERARRAARMQAELDVAKQELEQREARDEARGVDSVWISRKARSA